MRCDVSKTKISRYCWLRIVYNLLTSTEHVMIKPHMEGLIVVWCTLRELETFTQVEHAIITHGAQVLLAARPAAA